MKAPLIPCTKALATAEARVKWLLKTSHTLSNICDDFEDEGDRVYLGSTNDADALRSINEELVQFWCSQQDDEDDEEPTP